MSPVLTTREARQDARTTANALRFAIGSVFRDGTLLAKGLAMLTRLAPSAIVALAALLSGGCGGATPDPEKLHVEIGLDLGSSNSGFTPIADRANAPVAYGPQGGQHIWTSVRFAEDAFNSANIKLSSRFADTGQPAGEPSEWVATLPAPVDGVRTYGGMRSFLSTVTVAREVILRIEVALPDGNHGSDERTVSIAP